GWLACVFREPKHPTINDVQSIVISVIGAIIVLFVFLAVVGRRRTVLCRDLRLRFTTDRRPGSGSRGLRWRVDDPDRLLRRVVVPDPEGQPVVPIVEADLNCPMTCAVDGGVLIEAKADVLRDRQPGRRNADDDYVLGRDRLTIRGTQDGEPDDRCRRGA